MPRFGNLIRFLCCKEKHPFTFDDIHSDLSVVGELLEQGHDLLWRRRAHLYMVVPLTWTIPSGFSDRVMPEGYLGVTDATLVRLPSEFRILRGKLVREDRDKAMHHINWFCSRVQEEFWKELYAKGIVLTVKAYQSPANAFTMPWYPKKHIGVLVPKSLPHRQQDENEMREIMVAKLWNHTSEYYPQEPDCMEDYDEFDCLDVFDIEILPSARGPYLLFKTFEPLRQAISDILA